MIGKRGKILAALYMIFLVILFLMCSTDLIIREPENEIYQVAVIIEAAGDDNYGNFRKGMDQAAVECNADVRFITLYEELHAGQQIDLIHREQQDGADALIVAPVDEKVMAAVSGKQGNAPIVLLGTGGAEEKADGMVVVDYRQMGERLAEEMKKRIPADCPVFILADEHEKDMATRNFLEGAESVLEEGGFRFWRVRPDGEEGYREILEAQPGGKAAILAGSPEALTGAADILEKDIVQPGCVQGLFGRGNTPAILDDLDGGVVTGICVTDEFSRGYFSVRRAIEELERSGTGEPLVMDAYYIEKKDLREPKYEKMLFPME